MKKLRGELKQDSHLNGGDRYCNVAAAVIGGIGSALIGSSAAKSAAQTQADSANQASANTMSMFNTENANLQPFTSLGTGSINALTNAMGYNPTYGSNGNLTGLTQNPNSPLNQTFNFNPSDLQNYPGYQFALQQGLLGVNNSAAAQGLGTSSADVKNAAGYASGLAQNTYGQAYNQAQNTFQTNYNAAANNASRVAGLVQAGQNSAAMQANTGLASAQNAGNFMTSGAAAQAAGTVGSANALTNAIGGGLNYGLQSQYLNLANNAANGTQNGGWNDNGSTSTFSDPNNPLTEA